MEGPHRIVGNIADSIVNGVSGFGDGLVNVVKDAGEAAMSALDKPFTEITGMQGPHRAIDLIAKGNINAGSKFASQGVVGSVKIAGEGLMKALDHPLEQFGQGKFELPPILKK